MFITFTDRDGQVKTVETTRITTNCSNQLIFKVMLEDEYAGSEGNGAEGYILDRDQLHCIHHE